MLRQIGRLIVAGLPALPMLAQGFEAIAPAQAPQYRFDLRHDFYADEAAWARDLAEAKALVDSLQPFRGKVTSSGATLLELASKLERLDVLTSRLYIYRFLRYAADTTLEPQQSAADQQVSELNAKVSFVATELRTTSREDLDRLIAQEPKLAPYRFSLEQNTRYKPYTLSADQEELFSRLSPQLYSWEGQLFQKLIDRTTFSDLETPAGKLNVYRDRQVLSKQPDRELRKKALLTLAEEYHASADLFAFSVIKLASALNGEATTRGFKGAFASSLFDAHLTPEQAESFFETIGGFSELSRRYLQLKKERIRKTAGIPDPAPWDNDVVPTGFVRPQFTIGQATDALKASLAFHGPRYSADLAELLDPANGRLDIVTGKNRMPGAFSWGVYGAPHVFYSYGYRGYLDDVLTLSHEGGHAVHYDLIGQSKVLPVYASGPQYFTESFAMLNEFATADYLYQHATTQEQKIYFLEQLLDVMLRRFFDIVMRSEFEYRAYQKIQAGELTDAGQLHELWKAEGLRYVGDDYEKHDFLKRGWTYTPHFFTSPRYYINYMFANLMAISYYQRRLVDPEFDRRYVELMANGFPDTPVNLLKKHLGLDPFDPANVKGAMHALEGKLKELEALY
jgi:oligoendopeptidase F